MRTHLLNIVAFILLFSPLPSQALSVDEVVDSGGRFCDLMLNKIPANFPESKILTKGVVPISGSKTQSKESFEVIEQVWRREGKFEQLRPYIKNFKNGKFDELDSNLQTTLKNSRAMGNALRTGFAFFSREHAFPSESVERFVIEYGKMNDAIEVKSWKDAQKYAKQIYDQFEEIPESNLLDEFRASKTKDFNRYVEDQLKTIRIDLEKEELLNEDFHGVRKAVRRFGIYFAVQSAMNPEDRQLELTFRYLWDISKEMGDQHDELIAKVYTEGVDENSAKFTISDDLRHKILFFLDHLAIQP